MGRECYHGDWSFFLGEAERLVEKVLRGKSDVSDEGVCRKNVQVLMLIMCWPKVCGGGGRVLELLDSWGRICGAYRTDFLSPRLENVVPELCSLWSP